MEPQKHILGYFLGNTGVAGVMHDNAKHPGLVTPKQPLEIEAGIRPNAITRRGFENHVPARNRDVYKGYEAREPIERRKCGMRAFLRAIEVTG